MILINCGNTKQNWPFDERSAVYSCRRQDLRILLAWRFGTHQQRRSVQQSHPPRQLIIGDVPHDVTIAFVGCAVNRLWQRISSSKRRPGLNAGPPVRPTALETRVAFKVWASQKTIQRVTQRGDTKITDLPAVACPNPLGFRHTPSSVNRWL